MTNAKCGSFGIWHLALTVMLLAAAAPANAQTSAIPSDRQYITGTPQGVAILAAEDARAVLPEQLQTLLEAARSAAPELRVPAIRALGRLERRDLVSTLLGFVADTRADVRSTAAHAIGQAMKGEPLAGDPGALQVDASLTPLLFQIRSDADAGVTAAIATTLARLPYARSEQIVRVEAALADLLTLRQVRVDRKSPSDQAVAMAGALRAFEILGRTQRTLFSPSEGTVEILRGIANGTGPAIGSAEAMRVNREAAFRAVVAVRALDAETLRPNLTYEPESGVRQLAVLALAGAGSPIDGVDRVRLLRAAMNDKSYAVRFEAVRGYARHGVRVDGCQALLEMVADGAEHVALAAIDAVGDACGDELNARTRLIGEARTPADQGPWRRESHALVALAKRAPDHLEIPLLSHSRHNRWQVRMYAARAAGIAGDVSTLERLAMDDEDNVREATLMPLKRLRGYQSERFLIAALGRKDYQLLRTAARELAGLPPSAVVSNALFDALARVTAQRRETSRDARIALLQRIEEFGSKDDLERLRPLLRDFDSRIATHAAKIMTDWSGQQQIVDPQPLPREPLPQPSELKLLGENDAYIAMDNGQTLVLALDPLAAPMTSVRFLRLVNANYFEGLTVHRIVTNFVIQGGSPGANEYMGDDLYLRDEISPISHARGTVGVSTRGRDTGDAQFFINLVDNPRLDFDYTIFGRVGAPPPEAMAPLDKIQEGDRIKEIFFRPKRRR